jgi:hypothetical protein
MLKPLRSFSDSADLSSRRSSVFLSKFLGCHTLYVRVSLYLLLYIYVSVISASCVQRNSELSSWILESSDIYDRWVEEISIASSTPRYALGDAIGRLRDLRREMSSLNPPQEAYLAHSYILHHMDETIEGFLDVWGEREIIAEIHFHSAEFWLDKFTEELEALSVD